MAKRKKSDIEVSVRWEREGFGKTTGGSRIGEYERAFMRVYGAGRFPNRKLSEMLGPHVEEEGNDRKS